MDINFTQVTKFTDERIQEIAEANNWRLQMSAGLFGDVLDKTSEIEDLHEDVDIYMKSLAPKKKVNNFCIHSANFATKDDYIKAKFLIVKERIEKVECLIERSVYISGNVIPMKGKRKERIVGSRKTDKYRNKRKRWTRCSKERRCGEAVLAA